jgi:hypothetical protein
MERALPFDEEWCVQYGVEEYPLGDPLNTLGGAQMGETRVKVLRLVATPTEGGVLLRRLRNDPQTNGIPVIVLTH